MSLERYYFDKKKKPNLFYILKIHTIKKFKRFLKTYTIIYLFDNIFDQKYHRRTNFRINIFLICFRMKSVNIKRVSYQKKLQYI